MNKLLLSAALAGVLGAAAFPAAAQTVHGRLLDAETGAAIMAGTVQLLRADTLIDDLVTDSTGEFTLRGDMGAEYRIRAERLGYGEAVSSPIALATGATIEVEFRMSADAVALDPLTVVGEARSARLDRAGFYDRMRTTAGAFITRAEFDPAVRQLSDVFRRVTGVRVVRVGMTTNDVLMRGGATRNCVPRLLLDGMVVRHGGRMQPGDPVLDELIKPGDIEGVEIYRSAIELPSDIGGGTSPCGAILIWTRT